MIMKTRKFIGALALAIMCTCAVSSCKDDNNNHENNHDISIKLEEVGLENSKEAVAGSDLHVEAEVIALAKIKAVKVEIADAGNKVQVAADYSDHPQYVNVINATFHEHIDLPGTLPAGNYTLRMTVTDMKGNSKTESTQFRVTAPDPDAPRISGLLIGAGTNKAKAGEKVKVKAGVTVKSAVKEIEVEFHGKKEYPFTFDAYKGRTGSFNFEEEVTVPAEKGEYHVHFTVTDKDGRTKTGEVEGFVIE